MSAFNEALERIIDALADNGYRAIQDVEQVVNDRHYAWTMYAGGPSSLLALNRVTDTDTGELVVFDLWRPATGSNLVADDLAFIRGERK